MRAFGARLIGFGGAALLCVVVAAIRDGGRGAVSAAVGALIVCVFFGSTPAILGPVVLVAPRLSVVTSLMFYLTKVVALVALFVVLAEFSGPGRALQSDSLGVTVIVTTFTWLVASIIDAVRTRTPLYDLRDTADRFNLQ